MGHTCASFKGISQKPQMFSPKYIFTFMGVKVLQIINSWIYITLFQQGNIQIS